eukprot:EC712973.1.p3 GENE.EC712973.1~~EC712973.1.p3  ORF type:complete len:65 (+),score=0.34 EC712973.1:100-294(+)
MLSRKRLRSVLSIGKLVNDDAPEKCEECIEWGSRREGARAVDRNLIIAPKSLGKDVEFIKQWKE